MPQCVFGLINTIEIQKLVIVQDQKLSKEDLTILTHRKALTASGNRMRDSEDSKNMAQVSLEAGSSQQKLAWASTL